MCNTECHCKIANLQPISFIYFFIPKCSPDVKRYAYQCIYCTAVAITRDEMTKSDWLLKHSSAMLRLGGNRASVLRLIIHSKEKQKQQRKQTTTRTEDISLVVNWHQKKAYVGRIPSCYPGYTGYEPRVPGYSRVSQ